MEKEIPNVIEKLLDEHNEENIVLFDDENKATEFEQVAIIPQGDKVYAILHPVSPVPGVAEDEALVFAIDEIDDEGVLRIEDDEKIVNAVFAEYGKMCADAGLTDHD